MAVDLLSLSYPNLSPSILAADHSRLNEEIALAKKGGADFIHLDVMDGVFVPAKTLGAAEVGELTKVSPLINDVHIMIADPYHHALDFIRAGADILTFHLEACKDEEEVHKTIALISSSGVKVGISIKPLTPVEDLLPYLEEVDLVLIMSVEPGKGGQKFIPESLERIRKVKSLLIERKARAIIEVDGGINETTGKEAIASGVDLLVAGSYLYGHEDFLDRCRRLLGL
ncbi:MAG: ribulose-phosphate 3-epimerase [Bacilli bacterium]|nr:ribulose-phosphate 3-epimerase [Bacilli bacterium]